jgi:competence ComEA-like helix-hairpin-helix protein
MRALFTREERAVLLFLTVSLLVGSAIVGARRVFPEAIPDFSGRSDPAPVTGELAAEDWPVDVNTADVEGLDRLPGIGPARAREIIRTRERLGGFSSVEQLLEVRGIGPVTLSKIRSKATVGLPPVGSGSSGAAADTTRPPVIAPGGTGEALDQRARVPGDSASP